MDQSGPSISFSPIHLTGKSCSIVSDGIRSRYVFTVYYGRKVGNQDGRKGRDSEEGPVCYPWRGGKWIVIDIWVESAQGSKLDCLQRDYVYYKIAYEIKRRFFLSFFV